ncbi:MAG: hypothetical protein MR038_03350, partial [Oscillospiraceae bacterium]|nr:hypothetical protein [Oscillospiraceae bacterium]
MFTAITCHQFLPDHHKNDCGHNNGNNNNISENTQSYPKLFVICFFIYYRSDDNECSTKKQYYQNNCRKKQKNPHKSHNDASARIYFAILMSAQQRKKCAEALLRSIFLLLGARIFGVSAKNPCTLPPVSGGKADINQVVRHKSLICAAENPVLQD